MDWRVGDVARLKKPHACGGVDWAVERMGMDVRLRCLTCGRQVKLLRREFEKRVRQRIGTDDQAINTEE